MEALKYLPRSQTEVLISVAEAVKKKARYCERNGHRNPHQYKVGTIYVALCPDCETQVSGHLRKIAERLRVEPVEVVQIGG